MRWMLENDYVMFDAATVRKRDLTGATVQEIMDNAQFNFANCICYRLQIVYV